MSTPNWLAAVRREEQRQARQRAASANRRAALIREGVSVEGTQTAVAQRMGISITALRKTLGQADQREVGEPMADYMELDLPRAGRQVPTPEEWEALPADERPAAAQAAADTWRMIALVSGHLARTLGEVSERVAELLCLRGEELDDEGLRAELAELLPDWPHRPLTRGEADQFSRLLADLAAAHREHATAAYREVRRWSYRAGDDFAGMTGAD